MLSVVKATSTIPHLYCILNFGRAEMEQTGSGHFSCIGGYDPDSHKVLVMDTARFKYPPYWVDFDQLSKSIASIDEESGKMRGFIVVSKKLNDINSELS